MSVDCSQCGMEHDVEEWFDERRGGSSGKKEMNCSECGHFVSIRFYCSECDEYYGGRNQLKRYDNGSVAKHCCPSCDGLIRKGEVLDVTQGPYR